MFLKVFHYIFMSSNYFYISLSSAVITIMEIFTFFSKSMLTVREGGRVKSHSQDVAHARPRPANREVVQSCARVTVICTRFYYQFYYTSHLPYKRYRAITIICRMFLFLVNIQCSTLAPGIK